MLRAVYGKQIGLALAGARAGRGGGGGFHGGGGGGGFHGGGGGGFHAGAGFHSAAGFRGGSFHTFHAAPHAGRSYSGPGFQSRSAHTYAGRNAGYSYHGRSGISHSSVAPVSNRIALRNASAIGRALSS